MSLDSWYKICEFKMNFKKDVNTRHLVKGILLMTLKKKYVFMKMKQHGHCSYLIHWYFCLDISWHSFILLSCFQVFQYMHPKACHY